MGGIFSFAWGGFYGGDIGSILASAEQAGVFSYVLPFLLIFAVVFGILMKIKIFEDNRGLNTIIAFVVALMALQFDMVPLFFAELFPRVGVALSVILVLIILLGLFFNKEDNQVINYGLLGVAVVVFLVVITKTSSYLGWYSGAWWYENRGTIIVVGLIIAVIATVVNSVGPKANVPELKMHWPGK